MYIWNHRSFEWKGQNVDVVSSKKKTNKSSSTVSIDRSIGKYRDAISVRRLWREFSRFFFLPFFFFHFASRISIAKATKFFFSRSFSEKSRTKKIISPLRSDFTAVFFVSRFDRRAILGFPQLARIAIGDIAHEPAFKNRSKNRVNPNHERNVIVKK